MRPTIVPSLAVCCITSIVTSPLASQEVEHCDRVYGTLAVREPNSHTSGSLQTYQLGSPGTLIRMLVQKSNCFTVVERGQGLDQMSGERALAADGALTQDANVGKGQMVAADFYLTPNVLIVEGNAGGVGAAVGTLLRRRTGVAAAGGLKFKEAETSMLLGDIRSGIQVASATGKARQSSFSFGALGIGGPALAGLGGYANTNEGKVLAASLVDNYNEIVRFIRANPPVASSGRAAGNVFATGTSLSPKLANVPLLSAPSEGASVVAQLKRSDVVIFLGDAKDGFLNVQGTNRSGWVSSTLMDKAASATLGAAESAATPGDLEEGAVLYAKIAEVSVLAQPTEGAAVRARLKESDKLVYLGEERGGYLKVQAPRGEGWVRKALVAGRP